MTDSDKIGQLTAKQEQAIELLLSGFSVSEVASKLEISRTTLYSWQEQDDFRKELARMRELLKAESENQIVGLTREAIEAVRAGLKSEDDSTRARTGLKMLEIIYGRRFEMLLKNTPDDDILSEIPPEKLTEAARHILFREDEKKKKTYIFPDNGRGPEAEPVK